MSLPPLWYRVYSKQLSYKEFLDRFQNEQFQDSETLPIFILSLIYNHDPYIDKTHILVNLMNDEITEKAFKYFYFYWSNRKGFSDDSIIEGNNFGGNFHNIRIKFRPNFSAENLYDWIGIILKSFFNIHVFIPNEVTYKGSDMNMLKTALKYTEKVREGRFEFETRTMDKIYKIAVAHNILSELIEFFKSGVYPNILLPYRNDLVFFKNVVMMYSPIMLKSMLPFNTRETRIIEKAHVRLYDKGDVDFFLYYIDEFTRIFGKNYTLSIKLQKYLEPSNESDQLKAEKFLRSQNPIQRQYYLPQYFPITDLQLERFSEYIKHKGIVAALKPYLLNNKKRIQEELDLAGCELANDIIITIQCSIFLYSPGFLIFHIEDNKVYVFLPEEIWKFDERKNPYTRNPLPDYLYTMPALKEHRSENLEEIWTKILRHNINLQEITDDF
jgi:hypothetical protein